MVFSTLWITQIVSYQLDENNVDPSAWLNHMTMIFFTYFAVEYGVKVVNSYMMPQSFKCKEVLMAG